MSPRLLPILAVLAGAALLAWLVVSETARSPIGDAGRVGAEADPRAEAVTLVGQGGAEASEATDARAEAATEAREPTEVTLTVVGGAGEEPIPGASVVLRDMRGVLKDERTTDAHGCVHWADLRTGFSTVTVEAEGHGRVKTYLNVRRGRARAKQIVLPPAVTFRGVVVGGGDDRRVAGAQVRLVVVDAPGMSKDPYFQLAEDLDRTRTDARGEFAFAGCAEGSGFHLHGLVVSAEGYAPATKVGFSIRELLEAGGAQIALAPAGRVEGRLLGPDGRGTTGEVLAVPAHLSWLLGNRERSYLLADGSPPWWGFRDDVADGLEDLYGVTRVPAGADGRFVFDDLPLGAEVVLEGRGRESLRSPRRTLRVGRDLEPLVLRIPAAGRLTVVVRGPDGAPRHQAYVEWERHPSVEAVYRIVEQATTRTDAEGRAIFAPLTPGPFTISVWGDPIRQLAERGVLSPGADLTVVCDVHLENDAEADAEVVPGPAEEPLAPPDSSPPRDPWRPEGREPEPPPPLTIRARLRVPDGDPVPSGYVLHYEADGGGGRSSHGSWPEGQGRRLEVDHAWTGTLPLEVEARIRGYLPLRWRVEAGASSPVLLEERLLDPGLAVAGRVLDDAGHAVEGARVTLGTPGADEFVFEEEGILRETTTDADGRFLLRTLPPEELELKVRVPWHRHTALVRVRPELPELRVTVPRRAIVRGRLLDRDGLPVPREALSIYAAEAPADAVDVWSGQTDAAGHFRAEITGGRWRVALRRKSGRAAPWMTVAAVEVEIAPGGEAAVVLVADRDE